MFRAETFDVRLARCRPLTSMVRELVLERVDGQPMRFAPGQWINLLLPTADEPSGEVKKAYSIASAPDESPRFELAITRVEGGAASERLHTLAEGSVLRAIGPHGLFTRAADDPAPALFVCTGTGITPLRSMLRAALAAGDAPPMTLLFGCRVRADVLFADELGELARRGKLDYHVTLSQPDGDWQGLRGYVQAHVPELFGALAARSAERPHLFVCGLERMVTAVREQAKHTLGLERRAIHYEKFD